MNNDSPYFIWPLPTPKWANLCSDCNQIPWEPSRRFNQQRTIRRFRENAESCELCRDMMAYCREVSPYFLDIGGDVAFHWEPGYEDSHLKVKIYDARGRDVLAVSYHAISENALPSRACRWQRTSSPNISIVPRAQEAQVNYDLLRHWRDLCDCHGHEHEVPLSEEQQAFKIRFIDTDRKCLVDGVSSSKFAALSYVRTPRTNNESLTRTQLSQLSSTGSMDLMLPPTVQDAIIVAKELGYRYLFVDALCIVRSDRAERDRYNDSMDIILAAADLTIVVTSGDGLTSEIPGVRSDSRAASSDTAIGHPCNLVRSGFKKTDFQKNTIGEDIDQGAIEDYLSSTSWANCAWTFQESMLSRRLLIFGKHQVYWQCSSSVFAEERTYGGVFWRFDQGPSTLRSCIDIDLRDVIEEYSGKKLASADERWTAFSGVLHFMGRHRGVKALFGVDAKDLSAGLRWWDGKERKDGEHSELWTSSTTLKLPGKFPSWSWLAWTGQVQLNSHLPENCVETYDIDSFFVLSTVDKTLRFAEDRQRPLSRPPARSSAFLASVPEELWNSAARSHALVFRARAADCHFASHSQQFFDWIRVGGAYFPIWPPGDGTNRRTAWYQQPATRHCELRDLCLFVISHLKVPAEEQGSSSERWIEHYMCMLVTKREGVAYRIGLLGLSLDDFRLVEPELRRKMTILC